MKQHLWNGLRSLLLILVFCLSLSLNVFAQETTGTITGHVTDQNGAAVVSATVTITDPSHGFERAYQTTDDGGYTAPQLPVGNYTLTVEMQGFKKRVQENVTLNVNDRRPIDLLLETGQV